MPTARSWRIAPPLSLICLGLGVAWAAPTLPPQVPEPVVPAPAIAPTPAPVLTPSPRVGDADGPGSELPPLPAAVSAVKQTLTHNPPKGLDNYLDKLNAEKSYAVVSTDLVQQVLAEELGKRESVAPASLNGLATGVRTLRAEAVQPTVAQLSQAEIGQILEKRFASLTGLVPPDRNVLNAQIQQQNADAASISPQTLQASPPLKVPDPNATSFNWTTAGFVAPDRGIVSAPRFQAGCGCCWAFATIGAYEAAYALKHGGEMIGASEQYLLNNTSLVNPPPSGQAWGCGGGWWAFDMFWDAKVKDAGVPTRVSYVPQAPHYLGVQEAPRGAFARPFQIEKWGYVGNSDAIPDDATLRKALCEHGPLVIAIHAFTAWMGTKGVVLGDFPNDLSQGVNHAVVLIGWDNTQAQGKGAWIIKNSWGNGCGIIVNGQTTGLMYVKYGHNNIGYSAAWLEAK